MIQSCAICYKNMSCFIYKKVHLKEAQKVNVCLEQGIKKLLKQSLKASYVVNYKTSTKIIHRILRHALQYKV